MEIIMDTSSFVEVQVGGPFEPRLDKDGVHRRDKQGGTNLPLFAGKLVIWTGSDVETILVTVAATEPPKLTQGQRVSVERLQAMPWVQNGNVRVAYRAAAVVPQNGSGPSSKPAPAPNN